MPSVSVSSVPSVSGSASAMEMRLSQQQQQHSPHLSPSSHTPTLSSSLSQQPLHHSTAVISGPKWVSKLKLVCVGLFNHVLSAFVCSALVG